VSPRQAIFIESIANPGGVITDIEAVANIARRAGVPLIVDNTLATRISASRSIGADVVVHSLTKFLGGHGNSIGGLIVDAGTFNWSRENRYPMLSEPRPEYNGIVLHETFGNFFAIACRVLACATSGRRCRRSMRSDPDRRRDAALRMQRHCDNANTVAHWLSQHGAWRG
jgi:O-acetylhomoserine (thiol)-lyase